MALSFVVDLKDGVSANAKTAQKSVVSLEQQMKTLSSAIKTSENAMTRASANGNIKAYQNASRNLTAYKISLDQVKAQTSSTGVSTMGLQEELATATGGLSIIAEAALAGGLAFGAMTIAGMKLAIEASEIKERMTTLFDALGEGKISGKQTIAMLDELGDSIGQTRKQLAPFAQTFMAMGITGVDQLKQLTLAAASAGALAEGGGDAFTTMFKKVNAAAQTGQSLKIPLKGLGSLASMGLNVNDVALKMGISAEKLGKGLKAGTVDASKFGSALQEALVEKGAGPLQKMGMSLGNVWGKFQENITKLFEDIDVAPFLKEVKALFGVFDQAQPSGKAMKAGIGGFFKEAFAAATKLVPVVKHLFLDMVILALKAYVAAKPIVKTLKEIWAEHNGMQILNSVWTALVVVLKIAGTTLLLVAAIFGGLFAVIGATGLAIWATIGAVVELVSKAGGALADWAKSAMTAASDFVAGLVNGITNGAGAVVGAVKDLANGATGAFKNALGISSPSKVMMGLGGHVASGAAEGISAGVPDVHAASSDLAGAAAGGFAASSGGGKSGGGGTTINVGGITINGAGKSLEDVTEEALSLALERAALAQGL